MSRTIRVTVAFDREAGIFVATGEYLVGKTKLRRRQARDRVQSRAVARLLQRFTSAGHAGRRWECEIPVMAGEVTKPRRRG